MAKDYSHRPPKRTPVHPARNLATKRRIPQPSPPPPKLLAKAADTHCMMIAAPSAPLLQSPFSPLYLHNQREGTSELELASRTLSHAVNHLVNEQLAGLRSPLAANREAIAILCEAGRTISHEERREPARRAIAGWLRGSSLARALRPSAQTFN